MHSKLKFESHTLISRNKYFLNQGCGLGLGGLSTCLPDSDSKIVPGLGLGLARAGLGLEKNDRVHIPNSDHFGRKTTKSHEKNFTREKIFDFEIFVLKFVSNYS